MQNALQLPQAPPPLHEPIGLTVLLFEQPWILMVVALVVGLAISWWMKRRGKPGPGLAALFGGVAGAGLLFVLAKLVVTDREVVAERSKQLVGATASVDAEGLGKLLASDVQMRYFRAPGGLDKQGIVTAVRSELGQTYRVKDWAIQELQIAPSSPSAMSTQMRVRVTAESWNVPHVSWWAIDWRRAGDTWEVVRIQPLSIQFFQGNPGGF
ncbi:MAG: hypothetical protein U0570_03170 [Phycisphaerales bacterium]